METKPVALPDVARTTKRRGFRLGAPLQYLAIQAPGKRHYDVVVPAFTSVAVTVLYELFGAALPLLGTNGLIPLIHTFFVMAVPFLFGSLAAVAMGSPGEHMDRRARGVELYLHGEVLSLRQLVCFQLGYLCFVGLFSLIVFTLSIYIEPALDLSSLPSWVVDISSALYAWLVFALISVFTITTFWSLYFLTDIVNRR